MTMAHIPSLIYWFGMFESPDCTGDTMIQTWGPPPTLCLMDDGNIFGSAMYNVTSANAAGTSSSSSPPSSTSTSSYTSEPFSTSLFSSIKPKPSAISTSSASSSSSTTSDSASNGYSESEKIALGVGLGIGLTTVIISVIGLVLRFVKPRQA